MLPFTTMRGSIVYPDAERLPAAGAGGGAPAGVFGSIIVEVDSTSTGAAVRYRRIGKRR